jgi:HK97 family phage portal protein
MALVERTKTAIARVVQKFIGTLSTVDSRGGWSPLIREPYAGAWQRNDSWTVDTVLASQAVYACITLISNDIGKLRQKLVQQNDQGIWFETTSPAFSPVLRRPNRYQNHIQFKQWWITSKLTRGNTYALKRRDNRGIVDSLYLLDPCRVQVLVAPDGSVYYQLQSDNLTGIDNQGMTVPASEIIHDRMNCLFHPLVGVSPIYAAGDAASIQLKIQKDTGNFFSNGASPGGILMVPGSIPQDKADELKAKWATNYGAENAGKIAILPDGMKFQPMRMSAVESQLIEQMKWTAEVVCSTFHVPPYMIGVGQMPAYNNIEALNQQYYTQCLQSLIEEYETCMDEGLGLETKIEGVQKGVELDIKALLRMDTATQIRTLGESVKGSLVTINEARRDLDLDPVEGGNTVWMQQQNYSLDALMRRDAGPNPFGGEIDSPKALSTGALYIKRVIESDGKQRVRWNDSEGSWVPA